MWPFFFGISFKGLLTLFANGVLFVFMLYFYIFRKIACSENAKITNSANGFFGIFMMASIKMDLEGSFILKAITAYLAEIKLFLHGIFNVWVFRY